MVDVVINQKYIDRIAKELIINTLDFINDDYNFTENGTASKEIKKMVKSKNIFLKKIKGLDLDDIKTKQIYDILKSVYIFYEIDEDLYYDIKNFLCNYNIYYSNNSL